MKKKISVITTLFISLLSGVLGGFFAVILYTSIVQITPGADHNLNESPVQKEVYLEESQIISTVEKVSPSVVSIVITKDLPLYRQGVRPFGGNDFFGNSFFDFGIPFREFDRDENGEIRRERTEVGGGSGFIVSDEGHIVTNRHVVDDETADYTVVTYDGQEFSAEVLARDTVNDFAVIKIVDLPEDTSLKMAELGDSDKLKIGQKVVAIGNALAEYKNTVTSGIISAIDRDIAAGSLRSSDSLINLIQTDAAINPGNSGGPLVNLDGQVVAINTAIASGAEGIGFAIPINDVKNLIQSVEENGKIVRPFLGVRFMMLDEVRSTELQIDVDSGALLVGNEAEGEFAVIPGSPADKAGLKIKDVILELDGEKITLDNPLHTLVNQKAVGDTITLKVWRSGEIINLSLVLGEFN